MESQKLEMLHYVSGLKLLEKWNRGVSNLGNIIDSLLVRTAVLLLIDRPFIFLCPKAPM